MSYLSPRCSWRDSCLYAILEQEQQISIFSAPDNHMTLPSILIGIVISTLYGAAFHLWRGGNLFRLVLYLILAWIGFWVGHTLGNLWNFAFASLGPLRLGAATLGAVATLGIGYWLSLVDTQNT